MVPQSEPRSSPVVEKLNEKRKIKMHTAESLIAGYTIYSSTAELAETASQAGAPAVTPYTPFIIASSGHCVSFSVGATASAVTTTLAAGC